jgi:RimJ/RimL family protein N-acetyltransferase
LPNPLPQIELLPWDAHGLELLRALNTPEQKAYLGGPETEAKLVERQERYLTYHLPGEVEMLRIARDGEIVGSTGYWEREWQGNTVYEAGWEIIAKFHGMGIGKTAVGLLLDRIRRNARQDAVHAFPAPANAASNAICRTLGFTLMGLCDFEYPKGHPMVCNDWRLGLTPAPQQI